MDEKKRILVLNGSPRPGGCSVELLEEFFRGRDWDRLRYDAYRCGIGPCIDCRWCWQHDGCAVKDGVETLYQDIARCHGIVIASPIHYSTLSGPLISIAGRLQAFYAARRFRGTSLAGKRKPGVVLLAGGGDGSPQPALELAQILLRSMNADYLGWAGALHTDALPAREDGLALEQTRRLAREMARWPRSESGSVK
jgi:multimeric flavodoxin WrbA